MKPKVKFVDVSKKYNLFRKKSELLLDIFSLNKKQKTFYALKNISFEVHEGETIGVIGVNGSGKSTLSNLLAGIVPPTSGNVEINGETSLVAISAGLNNSLSGLENIKLKCLMHGLTKKEIEEVTPRIIEFADIGEFIHQPIKSYSSGMKSRLGFAISVHINPDILIVDEALSVGDQTFYEKCIKKFNDFKEQGKTIFFISHSISQVRSISDRVIWMSFGEIKEFDDKEVVLSNYQKFIKWFNGLNESEKKEHRAKMLNQQMHNNRTALTEDQLFKRSELRRVSGNKERKKGNRFFGMQIIILTALFLFSASLLFIDKPIALLKDGSLINNNKLVHKKIQKDDNPIVNSKKIKKNGLVIAGSTFIFDNKELSKNPINIPFGSDVFVEEEYQGIYKVTISKTQGYVDAKDIGIINESLVDVVNINVNNLVPLFPTSFANSFQFTFAHLKMGYADIKGKFNGLSEERVDGFGNKILNYNGEHVAFQFNSEDVASTITVSDVNIDDPMFKEISSHSHFQTKDGNFFYIFTNQYKIIVNKENKLMSFTSLD